MQTRGRGARIVQCEEQVSVWAVARRQLAVVQHGAQPALLCLALQYSLVDAACDIETIDEAFLLLTCVTCACANGTCEGDDDAQMCVGTVSAYPLGECVPWPEYQLPGCRRARA